MGKCTLKLMQRCYIVNNNTFAILTLNLVQQELQKTLRTGVCLLVHEAKKIQVIFSLLVGGMPLESAIRPPIVW